jgi:hypothetical protein
MIEEYAEQETSVKAGKLCLTSVDFRMTARHTSEMRPLHSRCCENLKSNKNGALLKTKKNILI